MGRLEQETTLPYHRQKKWRHWIEGKKVSSKFVSYSGSFGLHSSQILNARADKITEPQSGALVETFSYFFALLQSLWISLSLPPLVQRRISKLLIVKWLFKSILFVWRGIFQRNTQVAHHSERGSIRFKKTTKVVNQCQDSLSTLAKMDRIFDVHSFGSYETKLFEILCRYGYLDKLFFLPWNALSEIRWGKKQKVLLPLSRSELFFALRWLDLLAIFMVQMSLKQTNIIRRKKCSTRFFFRVQKAACRCLRGEKLRPGNLHSIGTAVESSNLFCIQATPFKLVSPRLASHPTRTSMYNDICEDTSPNLEWKNALLESLPLLFLNFP